MIIMVLHTNYSNLPKLIPDTEKIRRDIVKIATLPTYIYTNILDASIILKIYYDSKKTFNQ